MFRAQQVFNYADIYRELLRAEAEINSQYDKELVWDDYQVPMSALQINPATSKPDFDQLTGLGNVRAFVFDGASDETVFFEIQFPHAWQEGTEVHAHLHYLNLSATTNATVIWELEYTMASISATMGATTVMTATESVSVANFHNITELGVIDMTGKDISTVMLCSLTRRASVDTNTGEVAILSMDFHIQKDGNGSIGEYQKT